LLENFKRARIWNLDWATPTSSDPISSKELGSRTLMQCSLEVAHYKLA